MERKPYYITTAIAYASGKPHIGNTYEIILADAMARFKRYEGYDVFFMTGTDEHGQKIEGKAKDAGKTPKEFVDEVVGEIQSIFDLMNTSYDKFMRTTEPYHEKQVQRMFRKMYEKGDIKLLPPEEYAERVVLILSMLRPDIVVQRIVGRASANTLSVNGGRPWWEVKEYIEKLMRNRHIQQGSACNYLHGAAVRRFLHE